MMMMRMMMMTARRRGLRAPTALLLLLAAALAALLGLGGGRGGGVALVQAKVVRGDSVFIPVEGYEGAAAPLDTLMSDVARFTWAVHSDAAGSEDGEMVFTLGEVTLGKRAEEAIADGAFAGDDIRSVADMKEKGLTFVLGQYASREIWDEVSRLPTCEGQVARATWKGMMRKEGDVVRHRVLQNDAPAMHYFRLFACEVPVPLAVEWKAVMTNRGGSHYSFEEFRFPAAFMVMSAMATVATMGLVAFCLWRRRQKKLVPQVAYGVVLGMLFFTLSIMMEAVHLQVYRGNGRGLFLADMIAELTRAMARFITSAVLMLLVMDKPLAHVPKKHRDTVTTLTMVVMALAHLMLTLLAKSLDSHLSKHHDHDTLMGGVIMLLEVVLFAIFAWCVWQTFLHTSSQPRRKFLFFFGVIGGGWFLSLPGVIVAAEIFPPYYQHLVVVIGQHISQSAAIWLLSVLLLSSNEYYALLAPATSVIASVPGASSAKGTSGMPVGADPEADKALMADKMA